MGIPAVVPYRAQNAVYPYAGTAKFGSAPVAPLLGPTGSELWWWPGQFVPNPNSRVAERLNISRNKEHISLAMPSNRARNTYIFQCQ